MNREFFSLILHLLPLMYLIYTCVDPDRIQNTDSDPQSSWIRIQFGSGSTTTLGKTCDIVNFIKYVVPEGRLAWLAPRRTWPQWPWHRCQRPRRCRRRRDRPAGCSQSPRCSGAAAPPHWQRRPGLEKMIDWWTGEWLMDRQKAILHSVS